MSKGALGGLIAGVILLLVLLLVAISPQEASRISLNQYSAVRSVGELNVAEQAYAKVNGRFACKIGELGEHRSGAIVQAGLVDSVLASGEKSGYHFSINCVARSGEAGYSITGMPTKPGIMGVYAFCSDQHAIIWYSESGSPAECFALRRPVK